MFQALYKNAVAEWPKEIDAKVTHFTSDTAYLIEELDAAYEKAESPHLNSESAILILNLHYAIFTILHSVARFNHTLRLEDLRQEAVQNDFERRLRDALDGNRLWTPSELSLATSYFERS